MSSIETEPDLRRVDVGLLADERVLGAGVQVAERPLEPAALADRRRPGGQVRPLRDLAGRLGRVGRGDAHVGTHRRCQLVARGDLRLDPPNASITPARAARHMPVWWARLRWKVGTQREGLHVGHPCLGQGQLGDVVEHAARHAQRPRRVPGRGDRHHPHAEHRGGRPAADRG